jgi:hypothetical protein
MKKSILISVLMIVVFLIVTCDMPPLSEQEARQMMQESFTAIQTELWNAMVEIILTPNKMVSRGSYTDSYTNADGTLTITVTVTTSDTSFFPISWDGTIQFVDFHTHTENDAVLNGTVALTGSMSEDLSGWLTYNGDLSIVWKDTSYDVTWDIDCVISVNIDAGTLTVNYSGTYTINGYEYTFDYTNTVNLPVL